MKKLLSILCLLAVIMIPAFAFAEDTEGDLNGWVEAEGSWYYYQDGEALTGLQKLSDSSGETGLYYFNDHGERVSGLVSLADGSIYYFSKTTGKSIRGWKTVDGSRYYFGKNTGKALKGLYRISGERYYFSKKTAKRLTGWQTVNGYKYYFSKKTGKAYKGKHKIGKHTYYFGKNTARRLSGWRTIAGKKYYFSKKTYRMFKGIHKINGNVYTFSEKGVMVRKVLKNKPAVCLTYDDGPSDNTYTILNTLKKYDGLATFFVVGNRVDSYRGAVQKAYNMGCQIGNHTWSHPWLWEISADAVKSQMKKCSSKVKSVTGTEPIVCRTPGGDQTGYVLNAVGMPVILWSIDTRDWETQNASKTYSAVMNNVHDGDIVLMHDLYSATASASERIIPALYNKGYQMVTVKEMTLLKGKSLKKGKVYYSF